MLMGMMAVILPHLDILSWWIIGVSLVCGVWRIMVYRARWSLPGTWVKSALVIIGVLAIPASYRRVTGLDPAVALMIVAFVFKLLEVQQKRDAYLVIFLGYFVAITAFLYDQTIYMAAYILLTLIILTAALIALNQSVFESNPWRPLRISTALLSWSVPAMLILFIFFPRVEPLWSVNLDAEQVSSGVSDSMSPGDIAGLVLSDALAFRVTFPEGNHPPRNQLYWRGLVLGQFDGHTWTQLPRQIMGADALYFGSRRAPKWYEAIERRGETLSYSVIMEPTNQNWLFALPAMTSAESGLALVRDNRLVSLKPVRKKIRYAVQTHVDYRQDIVLSGYWRGLYTTLPENSNEKSRGLALDLLNQSASEKIYIDRVLDYYRQNFVYTLNPPLMQGESVDEFLLIHKQGFCGHFAGSFVFLMRAAGIPARVVVGYQGGEVNSLGNYLSVYQYDAHAWAEVWLADKGWVRVDPTAAVMPVRIEQGIRGAGDMGAELTDGSLPWLGLTLNLWLADLQLGLGALIYYWDSWVVGYTPSVQLQFLKNYLELVSVKSLVIVMGSLLTLVMLVMGWFLLRGASGPPRTPEDETYQIFCTLMARLGVSRKVGETPLHYARRLEHSMPELASMVKSFTAQYMRLMYERNFAGSKSSADGEADHVEALKQLRKTVSALRRRTLTARLTATAIHR